MQLSMHLDSRPQWDETSILCGSTMKHRHDIWTFVYSCSNTHDTNSTLWRSITT